MLKYSEANTKTKKLQSVAELRHYLADGRRVYSLDLLSGWSCPGASDCLAKAVVSNGQSRIVDGPNTLFRCFSASQEALFPNVYNQRKHNFDTIKSLQTPQQIANAIVNSLPRKAGIVRYHVGGDFFKLSYLIGATLAADRRPDVLFYAYTKALNFLNQIDIMNPTIGQVRPNFLITTSVGGKHDELIPRLGIRTATVVFSESEAGHLPIDHDDSHAAKPGGHFALLLHGVQPAGSMASEALSILKRRN